MPTRLSSFSSKNLDWIERYGLTIQALQCRKDGKNTQFSVHEEYFLQKIEVHNTWTLEASHTMTTVYFP